MIFIPMLMKTNDRADLILDYVITSRVRRSSWGLKVDLLEGMETGESLSPSHPSDSAAVLGDRKPALRYFSPRNGLGASLSSSEEGECDSAEAPPPQSPQYEDMLEVMTRAVAQVKDRLAGRGMC